MGRPRRSHDYELAVSEGLYRHCDAELTRGDNGALCNFGVEN